ncbi:Myeloid leukemia factor isoform X3 [Oopsacas minuta]|uniref:Myeloid leukemia factor isoform X3 n=1 Tax=Oopsacas minuta TaxID=111878 RepID=A0AAV7JVX7_9METZ|nr:Myeloid leukemia factor isoform X3 [Oopsacas minuta]
MVTIGQRFLDEFDDEFYKQLPSHPFKKGSNFYNYIYALDDDEELMDSAIDDIFWRDYHKARLSGLADPFIGIPFFSSGWRANERLKKFASEDPKDPYSSCSFGILSMSTESCKRPRPIYLARKSIRKGEGHVKQEVKHVYDYKKDKEIVAVVHQIGQKKHVVERHYNHRSGRVQDQEFYEYVEKCDEWWFDYEWKKRIAKLNKKIDEYKRSKIDEYLDTIKAKKEASKKRKPLPSLYPYIYLASSDDDSSDSDEGIEISPLRKKKRKPRVCDIPLSEQIRHFRRDLDRMIPEY